MQDQDSNSEVSTSPPSHEPTVLLGRASPAPPRFHDIRTMCDVQRQVWGLTPRELWWPAGAAVALLVINKAIIHDRGSSFGMVLVIGFGLGVIAVHGVKAIRRAAEQV